MNYKVFPAFITTDGKKVPIIKDWQSLASNDPVQISEWQKQYYGDRFIWGIPTGAENGILALDVDVKGANGWDTLKNNNLLLPETAWQNTPSGGGHILFQYPKDEYIGNTVKFMPGLDTRGKGGWVALYNLDQTKPLAEAPSWLIDAVKKFKPTVEPTAVESNYKLSEPVLAAKIAEVLNLIKTAPPNEGNNVLNTQAFEMGRVLTTGSITRDEVERLLYDAAIERGRPDYEARATIKSGLDGGLKVPLTCVFNDTPTLQFTDTVVVPPPAVAERWTPQRLTLADLQNTSKLKRPQLFAEFSSKDISILNGDGGAGKSTLLLYEAICMALGDPFLGFECKEPGGKTLFVTGEDSAEKLGAVLGQIMRQMGLLEDLTDPRIEKILNCVLIKKESDMCFVTRTRDGFFTLSKEALDKVRQACQDVAPSKVVFDPLALFSGPESQANDMAQAIVKFARSIVEEFGCCFEMVNHLGKEASRSKDMGQFGGRGASALPSHARWSKSMRRIDDDELKDYIDFDLEPGESANLMVINKASDGSTMFMKPFVIVRKGYLFRRTEIHKTVEEKQTFDINLEMFTWVKQMRSEGKYPTKGVIWSQFVGKVNRTKIQAAFDHNLFFGHMGVKFSVTDHPHASDKTKVIVLIGEDGKEV